MPLFRVDGKGIVKEVIDVNRKKIVKLPNDWDCTHVRVYKLKEIKILE